VDAPDLYITSTQLLHPEIIKTPMFHGSKLSAIDESKCNKCGIYKNYEFNAITKDLIIDGISCDACGVCAVACPVSAFTFKDIVSGNAYI
jgi:MinD superfamily P-loop ATPase